jgi:pilus assembly protein CpaE
MSVQSDSNYLRRAMLAGARDFLTKPFGGDELVAAIHRVHDKRPATPAPVVRGTPTDTPHEPLPLMSDGNVVATFSPKGGSGCSTIAVNIAVALAKSGHRTVLVDGSLQFGDVAVMLNMKEVTSLVDLTSRASELDTDLISSVVQLHRSELHVLLAPPRPEMAEVVTSEHMKNLVDTLRTMYDFVIVDTSSTLNDVTLALLDAADRILLVAQQSLPSLKNVSRFLNLAEELEYTEQKLWLVVNNVSDKQGISVKSISSTLKRSVIMTVPEDDALVSGAANQGVPLVTGANQRRAVSVALTKLANHVAEEMVSEPSAARQVAVEAKASGILGRLLGGN